MVSFEVSLLESRLITRAAHRAVALSESLHDRPIDYVQMEMDLTACHCNGCRLNLEKLLEFDDANFGHDVFGIRRFIDRGTGALQDCFLSRCAKPTYA